MMASFRKYVLSVVSRRIAPCIPPDSNSRWRILKSCIRSRQCVICRLLGFSRGTLVRRKSVSFNNPLVFLVVDAFLDQRFYDVQLTTGFFIKHYRHCFRDRATAELRRVWTKWLNNSMLKVDCSLRRFRGSTSLSPLLLIMVSILNGPIFSANSFVLVVSIPKLW